MKTKTMVRFSSLLVMAALISSNHALAQDQSVKSGFLLTAEKRSAIIAEVTTVFNEYYPLPDIAIAMAKTIALKLQNGEYDRFTDLADFTSQLTADLRSVSKDLHIRVWPYEKLPEDLMAEIKLGSPDENYGFKKLELLLGNIGYLELVSFNNPRSAGPTAVAAMNFLAHGDALIIDLRLNGGGDEAMARFLSSYFFSQSTHLSDTYIRHDDKTEQVWSQEWVPGPRLADIPIFILLSRFSYSSSEQFAYELQQLKRAVIIGEKTKGGVHAVTFKSNPELSINLKVPYQRDLNPYSKTTYVEGVIPDIAASSENALIVACMEAAKKLLETEIDGKKRFRLNWILSGSAADLNPGVLPETKLSEFVGVYQNVRITHECGTLFLRRNNDSKQELVPMNNDLFKYKDPKEARYRIQFARDEKGNVVGLRDLDSDGDTYPLKSRPTGLGRSDKR